LLGIKDLPSCAEEVFSHTPGGIRTPNPLIRSQMLYPVELPVHSEEVDTMSLAINQVNAFEDLEQSKRQRKM
jgi:hypothetical protein